MDYFQYPDGVRVAAFWRGSEGPLVDAEASSSATSGRYRCLATGGVIENQGGALHSRERVKIRLSGFDAPETTLFSTKISKIFKRKLRDNSALRPEL